MNESRLKKELIGAEDLFLRKKNGWVLPEAPIKHAWIAFNEVEISFTYPEHAIYGYVDYLCVRAIEKMFVSSDVYAVLLIGSEGQQVRILRYDFIEDERDVPLKDWIDEYLS